MGGTNKVLLVLIGNVVLFGLGYSIGTHGDTSSPNVVTKTEFIKVPEVITHVETKEVVKPEGLPASCETLITQLLSAAGTFHKSTLAGGKIANNLSDATVGIAMKDLQELNAATEAFGHNKSDFDSAATELATIEETLKGLDERCKADAQPHD